MPVSLAHITTALDDLLRVREIPDYAGALNGLQLEAGKSVNRVAVAVDASEEVITQALAGKANLLVVHHGLYWGGLRPLTGPYGRKLKRALAGGLSVYAAHLPLDVHPELGNNIQLTRRLRLQPVGSFCDYRGVDVGLICEGAGTFGALLKRCRALLGKEVKSWAGHHEKISRVGVITGGAGSEWPAAVSAGLDVLLTGEGAHYTVPEAREHGLGLIYGGHYATEQFGPQAVGDWLKQQFGLEWFFVDSPTGL